MKNKILSKIKCKNHAIYIISLIFLGIFGFFLLLYGINYGHIGIFDIGSSPENKFCIEHGFYSVGHVNYEFRFQDIDEYRYYQGQYVNISCCIDENCRITKLFEISAKELEKKYGGVYVD